MLKTMLLASTLALAVVAAATPAGAVTYDFNLSSSGYSQDTPVSGSLYAASGLTLSSPDGLVTACGGSCLSAGAGSYYGTITGIFNGITNDITFNEVTGNGVVSLYDQSGAFIQTLSSGTTYSGPVAVRSFTDVLNYDGITTITADDVAAAGGTAVPEPASLVLLGAGLFGAGLLRRRSAH